MAKFHLPRFSNLLALRSIDPRRLLALLEPYREFFAGRGFSFPTASADIDLQKLVDILLSPDEQTPPDLLNALFLINEMSNKEDMDILLAAAEAGHVDLGLERDANTSCADVAVAAWLADHELIERKHAEKLCLRPRSFVYFRSEAGPNPPFVIPTAATLRQLERDLDDWFERKHRGRGCRVFVYPKGDETWFLVRHGEPFRREESLRGRAVTGVCYRPLKYDVVVYTRLRGSSA